MNPNMPPALSEVILRIVIVLVSQWWPGMEEEDDFEALDAIKRVPTALTGFLWDKLQRVFYR